MLTKISSEMYKAENLEIRNKIFYDNSKGRVLLFQSEEGCLRGKSFAGQCTQNDGICGVCVKETETAAHCAGMGM